MLPYGRKALSAAVARYDGLIEEIGGRQHRVWICDGYGACAAGNRKPESAAAVRQQYRCLCSLPERCKLYAGFKEAIALRREGLKVEFDFWAAV